MAIEGDLEGPILEHDVAPWNANIESPLPTEFSYSLDQMFSGLKLDALEILVDVLF